MCWFDAESSLVPTDYSKFFDDEFRNVFERKNVDSPVVSAQIEKVEQDQFHYKIYLSFEDCNYLHEYQEYGTDWYTPQRIVKILNLELIRLKSDERLIAVDSGDQTAIFILGNPIEVKN